MKHRKITHTYLEVSFECSHRTLPSKLDGFLGECPYIPEDHEEWHEVLRDFEGDFKGLRVYVWEKDIIQWIADKLGIENPECDIHLVT